MSQPLLSPVSGQTMSEVLIEGVRVHFDAPSGGYWLEHGDLTSLADHHNTAITQTPVTATSTQPSQRICPVDGVAMVEHEFGDHSGIKVDECTICGGIWLDAGELKKVLHYLEANGDLLSHVSHQSPDDEEITATQRTLLFLYQLVKRPPLY